MNTDIVWGGLLVLGTVCATIQHYITKKSSESEIASLKTRLEFAKQETRIWKPPHIVMPMNEITLSAWLNTGANRLSTSILVLSRKKQPRPLLWLRS